MVLILTKKIILSDESIKDFLIFLFSPLHKINQREFSIIAAFLFFISQSDISARNFIRSLFNYTSFAPFLSSLSLLFRKIDLQAHQILSIASSLYSLIKYLFQIDHNVFEHLNQALIYLVSLSLSFDQDSKNTNSPFTIFRQDFLQTGIQAYFLSFFK